MREDSERPPSFCYSIRSSISTSALSTFSDEGYHSDQKPSFSSTSSLLGDLYQQQYQQHQQHEHYPEQQQKPLPPLPNDEEEEEEEQLKDDGDNHDASTEHDDLPTLLQSTRIIRISYSPATYALISCIILLSLYTLTTITNKEHTFPPFFIASNLVFHMTHLIAHWRQWLLIERYCIVYGTTLYWTGWLLGVFVFSERLNYVDPTTPFFWALLLERRHAWGLLQWEFTSQLESYKTEIIVYRIWTLLGAGSAWGLVYIAMANMDGYPLHYLLRPYSVAKLLLVSSVAGLVMICHWSFWTFQYRGVLWKREVRVHFTKRAPGWMVETEENADILSNKLVA
ncbi:hypothetical protein BDB00DRAFT_240157 [Zychaea mexicana]|uniref:uncharacterized protein n=1 Tax=Zychaea mexicana TaxID=64656 RepID=UPI0022FE3C98|nr:uncharacterized protein BDB00DRAFT_240157 [Zychaea mexicana]KAI9471409.1 hypothetical protein BDB00DRAFT_240157 [Zychaea mexicana]